MGLVMEVCEKDLSRHIEDSGGKLGQDECRKVLSQISAGLVYLESELGVNHGDLKPANVLMRNAERCEVVLSDLGMASKEGCSNKVGTVGYSSPEVLNGRPGPWDHTKDVFSVGQVGLEMATGKPINVISEESIITGNFLAKN